MPQLWCYECGGKLQPSRGWGEGARCLLGLCLCKHPQPLVEVEAVIHQIHNLSL